MEFKRKLKLYGRKDIDDIQQLDKLSSSDRLAMKIVSLVFPFRTNNYVIDEIIDWNNIPDDPIFQLTFPQKEMLPPDDFNALEKLVKENRSKGEITAAVRNIQSNLNPHPSGQKTSNVPLMDHQPVPGIQHKYRETVLVFPSAGQTCHAYCNFCFRWAQFIGLTDIKFATDESKKFQAYIKKHKEITDVLFTGGDPMVMGVKKLKAYIEPLLTPEFDHIKNIRIGTKSIAFWPHRFVSDKDTNEILDLFEKVMSSDKHLAIMGHFSHWVELATPVSHRAIRRLRNVGVKIRTQSPLIKRINDSSKTWAKMWREQVNLGLTPYYFFIERDTGAKHYFAVPLSRAFEVFQNAYKQVSGLGRTVRGPSMSAMPGKVAIEGITEYQGEKFFVLNFIQARNPDWVKRPFFAKYDEKATWLDELKPASGKDKFFFEDELAHILRKKSAKYEEYKDELKYLFR